jgi:hypothetical protein
MLLYSMLHLCSVKAGNPKYETLGQLSVTLDDVKRFRQLVHSRRRRFWLHYRTELVSAEETGRAQAARHQHESLWWQRVKKRCPLIEAAKAES